MNTATRGQVKELVELVEMLIDRLDNQSPWLSSPTWPANFNCSSFSRMAVIVTIADHLLATRANVKYAGYSMPTEETKDVVIGVRVSKRVHGEIVAEQQRIKRLNDIEPPLVDVIRMLIERGLANGKKR
jgi:hypothetical protein